MNKHMTHILILLISVIFFLPSCRSQRGNKVDTPDVGIEEKDMNSTVRLEAPAGWNSFLIGDSVVIEVRVISKDQIYFETNYGAKIFVLNDNGWIEVPNLMKYPEGFFILSADDSFPGKTAAVDPILPNLDHAVKVRIVLTGNIYIDGQVTEEKVASYIDVELKPK